MEVERRTHMVKHMIANNLVMQARIQSINSHGI